MNAALRTKSSVSHTFQVLRIRALISKKARTHSSYPIPFRIRFTHRNKNQTTEVNLNRSTYLFKDSETLSDLSESWQPVA
jgi:hypothetical protein